jgi:putative transposase
MPIVTLFQCLQPQVTATGCRRCSRIAWAMLVMTGRVTMLGRARWAGTGGSDRTVQRFFAQALPWAALFWAFFRQHLHCPDEVDRVAGDDVMVTQAGKSTHGLDRVFASLSGQPMPGLSFVTVSLVSVQKRRAFPLRVEQVVRSDAEKAVSQANTDAKQAKSPRDKRRPGRPKGSTNTKKVAVTFTPELGRSKAMLDALLHLLARVVPLTHLVRDGHFGNHNALTMARPCNVPRISTLRGDAALYFPSTGPYAGRGPHRQDGGKVDYDHIPLPYLQETTVQGHIQPRFYQAPLLHKELAQPVNVVIMVKTNLRTQAQAQVILFSRDLERTHRPLVDCYGLRFPIECNFRDAKQYWGLEDFMNVTPTGVTNAAHLALCMVNVAYRLRTDRHQPAPDYSVLDLKADGRGYKDVEETIQMLPEKPEPVLFAKIRHPVAGLGRIHPSQPSFSVL